MIPRKWYCKSISFLNNLIQILVEFLISWFFKRRFLRFLNKDLKKISKLANFIFIVVVYLVVAAIFLKNIDYYTNRFLVSEFFFEIWEEENERNLKEND